MPDKLICQKAAAGLLVVLTAAVAVTFSLLPRIPQPQSAHVFEHDHISVGYERVGDWWGTLLVVRSAHQNHRKLARHRLPVARRAIDVRGEFDSVPHGNHDVRCVRDAVAAVALSMEWNTAAEFKQQDNKGGKTKPMFLVEISHRNSPTRRVSRG